ncbi:MAG: hypothetical protein KBT11_08890 [Treponema sp.]|nr:hypothetical protein [Candidatus Treponema equifaecale]
MSTAYGYVRMQFTKEDGSADGEITKKIYRYCTEKFDFFNTPDDDWERYGDAFELIEEIGEIGSAYMGDGLYIKNAVRDAYEEDWLQDIYNEFKPYQMKVQILWDYTEFSFDENYITRYMVSENDDQRTLEEYDRFNFTDGGKFDSDRYHFTHGDADDCYPLLDSDYNECSLMAKTKTQAE